VTELFTEVLSDDTGTVRVTGQAGVITGGVVIHVVIARVFLQLWR